MAKNIIRALRLPFITASILPFIFGSLICVRNFNFLGFLLGISSVISTHLSANLINDYFDSKSGVDWQDKNFYGFFGGSKLIQENLLSEQFYLKGALFCACLAFSSVICLALVLKSAFVVLIYLLIITLSWQYTAKPLAFSYNYFGEFIILLLFGPALVMGGYFIQTGIFPDLKSFIMSLPLGLFTAAILYANEIPDFPQDSKSGKNNLVKLFGHKNAYIFYYVLMFLGFLMIILSVFLGYLGSISLVSLFLILLVIRAGGILKESPLDKLKLIDRKSVV